MGNQATSATTGFDLSTSNRRSRNFSAEQNLKNVQNEQIQSTLINCFALGDDMIYYLWKFYDLDHNNELDLTEMRTFLTELIHTLHDVCLRSELLAYETGKKRDLSQSGQSTQATTTTSTAASTGGATSTSTTNSSTITNETDSKQLDKKKSSRFAIFKKKNRMSTDFNEKKASTPLWRRSRNLSDEDSMKRRSVAVIPGAGIGNHHNFEQMITGNTEQDDIKRRWKAIREHMEGNIGDIIKKVDKDQNGTINYQEFLEFMKTYDIKDMLNNIEPSMVSPNLLDGKLMGLFSEGLADDNVSDVSSPRSITTENPTSPQTKEGRRKSAIFQVLSHTPSESSLPSLDLPSNKKPLNKGDLLNTVIFSNGQETLDFLAQYKESIDRVELNAALRRAIVDNNPSKTRAILKYGAAVCQSFKDENQEENSEGFDMLTTSLLKALASYSPCMDGGEIEKLQLIIRLLVSKGWFGNHNTDENSSQFKQLSPDIIYESMVSHNDSMSMYEDELRDALGETKSFEEIESEYSSQLED
ncbi:EF-hand domain-containing protein [Naegleria gruberi]|uniref:EF-hand domain-containing protein n=1 Tax=Naegleria gruberi TaxID=5762 RepID=D2VDI5_NAEGR|nr:EF-hand domain-containing protein [Naegleria gruberi]EFC45147.1 EF-hand domain-containing protein [Naegleria gruberi]|eukprot:XP_002677891.1 EF-hand domain-containing protein [Naegleria gruberi strain NEG-M]